MQDLMERFNERSFSTSRGSRMEEPWHSTPVRKDRFAAKETPDDFSTKFRDERRTRPAALNRHDLSKPMSSFSSTKDFRTSVNGLDSSTIQRQRVELEILAAELKDREQELNTMTASHQKQLQSWEQDRQTVKILEQKCAQMEDELRKNREVIRDLNKQAMVAESREADAYRELNSTKQQLHELTCRQMNTNRREKDLEEMNQNLKSTVTRLSKQVELLEVHEEELRSLLKLKDKDMIEATDRILEQSGRICGLEQSIEELEIRESEALREIEEHKDLFRESRLKNGAIKAELRKKIIQNINQKEELTRLKQENQLLKTDIVSAERRMMDEEKSWRDDILELSRSKQTRVETELHCLQQVYENQQNDLHLLKLNLQSAKEALRHYEGQRSHERTDSGLGYSRVLKNSDRQERTELETGLMSTLCHNTSGKAPSILMQPPCVEMETQTDININEQESPKMEMKERANDCIEPSSQSLGSDNAKDLQSQAVFDDNTSADVDIMGVINYDSRTGTPVFAFDVDVREGLSCTADLSYLPLDCSSHSSPNLTLSTELRVDDEASHGSQGGCSSSTTRLQRLLAESQKMVASLASSPETPQSTPQSNHGNVSQISTHSQEGK